MTQEMLPDIRLAAEATEKQISATEGEIAELQERIKTKKQLVRSWRKALAAFSPRPSAKKRAAATS